MKKRSKEGSGKGTKESETQETSSQTQIQSTWPVQCGRTSEGFWQSRATHLTQWPMPERHESRFSRRLQAQRDLLRKRSLFNPQGCETLKEFRVWLKPSGRSERRSMRGERGSLGTLSCYSGDVERDGQGECMITPLGKDVGGIFSDHALCIRLSAERCTLRARSTHARVPHCTSQTRRLANTARNKRSAAQHNTARDARVHLIHVSAPQPCGSVFRVSTGRSFCFPLLPLFVPARSAVAGEHVAFPQRLHSSSTVSPCMAYAVDESASSLSEFMEEMMDVVLILPRTRQNRTVEQIVDVSFPQVKEKIVEVIGRPPRANTPYAGIVTSPRRRLRWTILWIRRARALRTRRRAVSLWSVWTWSQAYYLHRWLTASSVFAFGNGDIRDQLRRACQGRVS